MSNNNNTIRYNIIKQFWYSIGYEVGWHLDSEDHADTIAQIGSVVPNEYKESYNHGKEDGDEDYVASVFKGGL